MSDISIVKTKDLTIRFGGLIAVNKVNINLTKDKIWALIGPNGAGKSTLLNLLTGIYQPTEGEILFKDESNIGLKSSDVAKKGIGRTFQNIMLFKDLTVLQNVMTGYTSRMNGNIIEAIFNLNRYKESEKKAKILAEEMIDFLGLSNKKDDKAGSLSYGEQKLVEIARALTLKPDLLLLDEPVAGMNSIETGYLISKIKKINDQGITILLVEHDMNFVMGLADRIIVLDFGKKVAEGKPEDIQKDPKVIEAYLGGYENARNN